VFQAARRTPSRLEAGFTLIELMIVVSIIAIIASIAVPNLVSARMNANEAAAVSVLRAISVAEAQFSKSTIADENGDGEGEYGYFGELTGRTLVRGASKKSTADLSATMALVGSTGEVERSGYIFRMYLPAAGGVGTGENAGGGIASGVLDAGLAQAHWCCYAYPASHDASGRRTYFVNEHTDLMVTESSLYQTLGAPFLFAGAAFKTSNILNITGNIAFGTKGADGNFWKAVQ
jgi:prepilin-type N-terminal cleavage/methylation domain-containing protein